MAAKKKSKSKSKSKSPTRRRKQSVGFLKSAEGKMLVHAGVGAGLAGVVESQGIGAQYSSSLPGREAGLTALALALGSALVKKPAQKKLMRTMAVGATAVAIYNAVTESPSVQNFQIPGMQSTQSALTALPGGRQAAPAVSDYLKNKAPAGARG